jgi:tetratricopeptide (TPR) repeat protein
LVFLKKRSDSESLNVAKTLNNMASLYRSQGQYEKAERLYRRALAIKEKVLGSENPEVVASRENLARFQRQQGKKQS